MKFEPYDDFTPTCENFENQHWLFRLGVKYSCKKAWKCKNAKHVINLPSGTVISCNGFFKEKVSFVSANTLEQINCREVYGIPPIKPITVPFEKEAIKKHLDDCIRYSRRQKKSGSAEEREMAIFYTDAYQSVRVSLFGELLPLERENETETNKN